ncbi:hypothetical protein CRYUN_Cryun15aG0049600 [Craigia yunnanensis]
MALLVEGLGIGGETSIEEYIISPADELANGQETIADKDKIRLYGPKEGLSWVAKPITGRNILGLVSIGSQQLQNDQLLLLPLWLLIPFFWLYTIEY